MMNVYKNNIIDKLTGDFNKDEYEKMVDDYLLNYPGDTDIIIIKAYIYLLNDKIYDAIKILDFVLRKNPLSVDALFLIGQAYSEVKKIYDALTALGKARILAAFLKINGKFEFIFFNDEICASLLEKIIDDTMDSMSHLTKEEIIVINDFLKDFKMRFDAYFDFFKDIIRSKDEIIGHNFSNNINDLRFCALYDSCDYNMDDDSCIKNLRIFKTEMLKQFESGNSITFRLSVDSMVPILAEEKDSNILVKQDSN